MVYKFDESNFDAEVLQSDLPVFVDFCGLVRSLQDDEPGHRQAG